MIIFKIYQLNKIEFDIDILDKQLTPLQIYIKPNSAIGFYTNISNSVLFIEMQYIMAPLNIQNKITPDTLLLIQFPNEKIKTFDHYRTIIQNQQNGKIVSLITKLN
ncbi:hypothetical protein [Mucilaginibacter sp.]|uniref:hypothetical protein n=1 Tax=Mucilaginibacter sp. TaxID=1882438 RepID=UPI002626759F|nr:hypothetical protein [Mucilaginibacter sp.]